MPLVRRTRANLTQRRVRFFWRRGVDTRAHTALLRAALQGRHVTLLLQTLARFPHELIYGRHLNPCYLTTPRPKRQNELTSAAHSR